MSTVTGCRIETRVDTSLFLDEIGKTLYDWKVEVYDAQGKLLVERNGFSGSRKRAMKKAIRVGARLGRKHAVMSTTYRLTSIS